VSTCFLDSLYGTCVGFFFGADSNNGYVCLTFGADNWNTSFGLIGSGSSICFNTFSC